MNVKVASEISARLGRLGMNKHQLATLLDVSDVWVGRRLSFGSRQVTLSLDDVERIAAVLNVDPVVLLRDAVDQRRDSGEPSES